MANTRKYTETEQRERAVIAIMSDWPLKRSQMLLFGPKSVKILSTRGAYQGSLPDAHVFDSIEWKPD